MKNYLPSKGIFILLILVNSLYCFAQENKELKIAIESAINRFKMEHQVIIVPSFQKEIADSLYSQFQRYNSSYVDREYIYRTLQSFFVSVNYAYAPTIIKDSMGTEEAAHDVQYAMGSPKKKYAVILVKLDPSDSNADIIIDDEYICSTDQARKGILLKSGNYFKFRISIDGKDYCQQTLYLESEERHVINCKTK